MPLVLHFNTNYEFKFNNYKAFLFRVGDYLRIREILRFKVFDINYLELRERKKLFSEQGESNTSLIL